MSRLCVGCNSKSAKFAEEHTGRLLCSRECQMIGAGLPLNKDMFFLILQNKDDPKERIVGLEYFLNASPEMSQRIFEWAFEKRTSPFFSWQAESLLQLKMRFLQTSIEQDLPKVLQMIPLEGDDVDHFQWIHFLEVAIRNHFPRMVGAIFQRHQFALAELKDALDQFVSTHLQDTTIELLLEMIRVLGRQFPNIAWSVFEKFGEMIELGRDSLSPNPNLQYFRYILKAMANMIREMDYSAEPQTKRLKNSGKLLSM